MVVVVMVAVAVVVVVVVVALAVATVVHVGTFDTVDASVLATLHQVGPFAVPAIVVVVPGLSTLHVATIRLSTPATSIVPVVLLIVVVLMEATVTVSRRLLLLLLMWWMIVLVLMLVMGVAVLMVLRIAIGHGICSCGGVASCRCQMICHGIAGGAIV